MNQMLHVLEGGGVVFYSILVYIVSLEAYISDVMDHQVIVQYNICKVTCCLEYLESYEVIEEASVEGLCVYRFICSTEILFMG